jgi:hypothetical protein
MFNSGGNSDYPLTVPGFHQDTEVKGFGSFSTENSFCSENNNQVQVILFYSVPPSSSALNCIHHFYTFCFPTWPMLRCLLGFSFLIYYYGKLHC